MTENRFLETGEKQVLFFNRENLTLKVEKKMMYILASSWANSQLVFRNRSLETFATAFLNGLSGKDDVDPT